MQDEGAIGAVWARTKSARVERNAAERNAPERNAGEREAAAAPAPAAAVDLVPALGPAVSPALAPALGSDAPAAVARPTNYARSLLHFTSASVGLATVALLPSHTGVLGIAIAFATYAWSMEIVRRLYPPFNVRLMRFYGRVAHAHEHYRVNSATWYATALVLLALFATRPATMASLAVLGVADPIAALVGRRWGKRMLRAGRSLEGSLAFLASAFVAAGVALVLAGGLSLAAIVGLAALAAFAGGVAELFSTKLDDNLTIPLAVGAALTAVGALLG